MVYPLIDPRQAIIIYAQKVGKLQLGVRGNIVAAIIIMIQIQIIEARSLPPPLFQPEQINYHGPPTSAGMSSERLLFGVLVSPACQQYREPIKIQYEAMLSCQINLKIFL